MLLNMYISLSPSHSVYLTINNIVIIMIVIIFVINAIKQKRLVQIGLNCPLASCSVLVCRRTLGFRQLVKSYAFSRIFTSFRLIYRMFVMVHLNYYAHFKLGSLNCVHFLVPSIHFEKLLSICNLHSIARNYVIAEKGHCCSHIHSLFDMST